MTRQEDVLIATLLDKRLDAELASDLRNTMLSHIDKGEHNIVLNIAHVDFIDSTGLGAIVACRKALGQEGRIVITGTRRPVMTMFKLTRMDKVFQMLDSDEEAMQVLARS